MNEDIVVISNIVEQDSNVAANADNEMAVFLLKVENLNVKDLNRLWSILSGKYLPPILYRIRMLTFDSSDVKTPVNALSDPETQVGKF